MKFRTCLFLFIILLVLCCFGSIIFAALYGNFESNGKCVYSGSLSTKTGACISSNSSSSNYSDNSSSSNLSSSFSLYSSSLSTQTIKYNGKYSSKYSFNYPSTFFIDDTTSANLNIYSTDPTLDPKTRRDTMSIINKATFIDFTAKTCSDLINTVSSSTTSNYKTNQLSVLSELTSTPNFTRVCKGSWDSVTNGITLHYTEYFASDKIANNTYIMTIAATSASQNQEKYIEIVNSFKGL